MEVKQQVVERTLYDPLGGFGHEEGWMPTYAHNMLRGLLGVGYSVAMIRLLRKEYKRRPEKEAMFPELNRWLWVVALMLLVFSASLVVILCLPRVFSADVLAFSMYFWLSTPQIVTSLTLLGNPTILYGLPRPERPAVHEPVYDDSKKKKMPDPTLLDQYQYYLDTIHAFMGTQKPFLQQRYTLNDLAKDVQIPEHHISFVLNHLLNMRFNDFMNLSRIRYLEQRIQSEDVSHLSLEGLANEAGFGSRITFIRAVQRHTGRNPSDYFNVREPDNIPGEPGRQF
jgi:AraC-like DNA-binding protein